MLPLPDDLPPSLYYCGEMMSQFSVRYKLTAMLIGLKGNGSGVPNGQLVIQETKHLFMREFEAAPEAPITVMAEGKVSGAFGLTNKGQTKVEGQLLTPRAT